MTRDVDVVVIGAGIIGCAVARELAERRLGVEVIDARDVARGATQASAGMLAPYIEGHEGGELHRLMVRSLALYDSWIDAVRADSGIDVEYQRTGSLEVAFDVEAAVRLRDAASSPGGQGKCFWLDAPAARLAEPALPASILGALSVPTHGYVAAQALTEALARAAAARGARFHHGVHIARVDARPDHVVVTADSGAQWRAQRLVVASGSWTGQIAGLPDLSASGVRPVRGQLLRVRWQGRPMERLIWGPACYLVPWRDGTVLIGATMEEVGFEERNTAAGVRMLLDAARTLVPALDRASFIDARAGLRPATSDGLPIIGPSASSDRVVYATGHYRNGILLAPLTARLVTGYLLDGRTDSALEALGPGRRGLPAAAVEPNHAR